MNLPLDIYSLIDSLLETPLLALVNRQLAFAVRAWRKADRATLLAVEPAEVASCGASLVEIGQELLERGASRDFTLLFDSASLPPLPARRRFYEALLRSRDLRLFRLVTPHVDSSRLNLYQSLLTAPTGATWPIVTPLLVETILDNTPPARYRDAFRAVGVELAYVLAVLYYTNRLELVTFIEPSHPVTYQAIQTALGAGSLVYGLILGILQRHLDQDALVALEAVADLRDATPQGGSLPAWEALRWYFPVPPVGSTGTCLACLTYRPAIEAFLKERHFRIAAGVAVALGGYYSLADPYHLYSAAVLNRQSAPIAYLAASGTLREVLASNKPGLAEGDCSRRMYAAYRLIIDSVQTNPV